MIGRYVALVVRYPKWIVAAVLVVTLLAVAGLGRLRIELDVDKQIPQSHPLVEVSKRLEHAFGGKYLMVVGFYPTAGTVYTPEILSKVRRVTQQVEKLPGVDASSVLSLMSDNLKDIVATDAAIEVVPLADHVPRTDAELASFRERVRRGGTFTDLLVNQEGTATTLLLDFSDFAEAGGARGFYPKLDRILQKERDATIRIEAAGAPAVLYYLGIYTVRIAGLFVVALAMIGYLHYRAFRTLQGMFIPLVTALLGVVWALGLVGWAGIPMDPWNMMTPILLLAVGAGHSVQILKRYYEEYARLRQQHPEADPRDSNRLAVTQATTKMGTVMLAAGSIAGLSFLSLLTMKIPSMQNFGLCTSIGIFAALFIELTFIPAVRVMLPPPSEQHRASERKPEFFDPWIEKIATRIRSAREGRLFYGSLLLIAVLILGIARLQTKNSLREQFFDVPSDVPIVGALFSGPMEAFRLADERTSGTRVLQVLVEGEQADAIKQPRVLRAMDEVAQYARGRHKVGRVVSLADVVHGLDSMVNQVPPRPLPTDENTIAQYFLLYSMAGNDQDLRRLVDADFKTAVITIYLRSDDHRLIKTLITDVQRRADQAFAGLSAHASVGGGVANAVALNETIVHGKISNLIQISLLVFLITSAVLRSLYGGVLVLLPLAISALVNLGVMGWVGVPLNMGTAAISAMAVGIGADYAIYFIFRVREQLDVEPDLRRAVSAALLTSGKAISYVATAVAGGYLCLCLSLSKVHVELGVLVALTMLVCSFATIALLPAVVVRLQPDFLSQSRKSRAASASLRSHA